MPRAKEPPVSLQIFGKQSRYLREKREMTRRELAALISYSESLIAMVERGERPPKPGYVDSVDAALGADGLLAVLAPDVAEKHHPAWAEEYVKLQAEALALHVYSTHFLHGLLQTKEYAQAVFRSVRPSMTDEEIEKSVQARLATQKLLTRTPACRLTFVLEESTLLRKLGGQAVWEGQLRNLLKLSELHNVQLQIMPLARETHAGVDGPMTLLETPDHHTIVYVEGQRGSYFITEPDDVSVLSHRYGTIRAQALDAEASRAFIQRLLTGEA
ncbi:helix-turn-helix domain-containing protein [Streptomyces purpurogeneiscleroticus]|uniref:helix-turn-helix domain-containing protein n=1 Tax=Streptomyces purpurogeneiscleroticus TaxID=68259 RepID=UPI001CBDA8D1|nr:helix-turn-helix transcriptional regulator [Streptomyces purpurogeneiscleroticus]